MANDRQTKFELDKFTNLRKFSTPQTNFRIGYFLNDHYGISFGFDHMKYVVQTNQTVNVKGDIAGTGTIYDRNYNNEAVVLSPDFIALEHTDGLNFLNIGLRRMDKIFAFQKVKLIFTGGIDAGVLVPRTDAELLNFEDNDKYHLSGYGVSLIDGLNVTFFDYFFIQSELKGGYINMPDMRTTPHSVDKADQSFFFAQHNVVLGWVFHFVRKGH